VSLDFWNSNMMRGVQEPGPWQGEYLAICLSPNPGTGVDRVIVPASAAGPTATEAPPAGSPQTPNEISERAEHLASTNPFAGVECLNEALAGATPVAPLFVQGVNEDGTENAGEAYYIVPFVRDGTVTDPGGEVRSSTQVPLLVVFNAYTGEVEEAVGMPEGTTYDADWINPTAVSGRSVADQVRQRASDQPDAAFPYRLVWRPSAATPSRFWPLLEGDSEDPSGRGRRVYTRIDGEVLTKLEPLHG
jgi:hypothetical protein